MKRFIDPTVAPEPTGKPVETPRNRPFDDEEEVVDAELDVSGDNSRPDPDPVGSELSYDDEGNLYARSFRPGLGGLDAVSPLLGTVQVGDVLTLDPSALMIGVILGARNFLPTLLSIHGGAMMDHLGAKRVMMVFALVGVVVHLIYPLAPWIWAVLILQMLSGLSTTMAWMGTQTLIGQIMKGNTVYSGRLSSAALIGNLTVPPIIGAAWDILGPWGRFAPWPCGRAEY